MSSFLFFNGTILTMDPRVPEVEAVWVENDRIREVGSFAALRALSPEATLLDLAGKCL